MKKKLGYSLIAFPFIVIFIFAVKTVGILGTFIVFGLSILLFVIISLGVWLIG